MVKRSTKRDWDELKDMLRMWPTLILMAATFALVWWLAPQQVGILVYTIAKLSLAGYLGYWLDRWVFPESRPASPTVPDAKTAEDTVAAEYRRAAIICASIISAGLLS